jgi:hypothetical protein
MVEPQIVVLDVAGSSPVGHPIFAPNKFFSALALKLLYISVAINFRFEI